MFDAHCRTAFLKALAATGSVSCAAAMVGIDRTTAYVWRRRYPGFALRWRKALSRPRVCAPASGMRRHASVDLVLRKLRRMARSRTLGSRTWFFDNELPAGGPQSLEHQGLGDFR